MGYDSGLYLPRAHVALMRRQVTAVTRALRGVREGAAELGPGERHSFAGVALFADYMTDAAERDTYRQLWLAHE